MIGAVPGDLAGPGARQPRFRFAPGSASRRGGGAGSGRRTQGLRPPASRAGLRPPASQGRLRPPASRGGPASRGRLRPPDPGGESTPLGSTGRYHDGLMNERYYIRTFGCQMNEHDSERIAGLLEAQGMAPANGPDDADLVVLNTCAVRENADNKLYGALGHLATTKARRGLTIAVGGCLAQKDQGRVLERAPWVDVVFGTHNIGSLPVLLRRAREQGAAQAEFFDEMQAFPSALPARREADWSAWVAISVGCNNTCTFCIVPKLRGKERSRRVGDVVAEVEALVASGVAEITLLGQNVNSYGTDLPGHRQLFGDLLRGLDRVGGLERLRFTSPNPKDFRDDVVDAMANCRPLCEHVHFPLQSGSDRVLRLMRRGYRRRRYLEILGKLRAAIPGVAFSTDIIVGFPGETEEDFRQTLELVEEARFDSAFTFQYSPRPGTDAAGMPDQVPAQVVGERFQRLVALQERIALERNSALVGTEVELLVERASSKTDSTRMSGRTRTNKLCHFPAPGYVDGRPAPGEAAGVAPGDLVTVQVEHAAPHHLLAGPVLAHRPRPAPGSSCAVAPPPRPLPAGAVPLPLVG
jgi:tRNA-2-methylthio-N6-dimethylallyladenosine synthase